MGTRAVRLAATATQVLQPDRQVPFSVTVASVGTPAVIWAPEQPNSRFRFMGADFSTSVASVCVGFKDSTASAFYVSPKVDSAAKPYTVNLGRGYLSSADGNSLRVDCDVAGVAIRGTVFGREE